MNNTIKKVLLVIGIALIVYGIYAVIAPEASVGIGDLSIEAQDNSNAYLILGGGVVALIVGLIGKSK
tara:strand:- start:67283 stop:67483 length:201 start_codon:yes stop_codon:yes gene_type:complete